MRLKNILTFASISTLIAASLIAQNTNPVVTNVAFSISSPIVTVTYDVTDLQQNKVTISMEVSSDSGATWNYNYGSTSGDIGANVSVGNGKTITWTYTGAYNSKFKIKIIANDLVVDGSPCAEPTVTYSGKTYNTVQIGTQCWLKENLDVGIMVQGNETSYNDNIIEKYCYDNNPNNCSTYGGLYLWAEAVQYKNGATNLKSPFPAFDGNIQGICPVGWHIPTLLEFETLAASVNNDGNDLKAKGQGGGDGAGRNTSGFSSLLAGYRGNGGVFAMLGGSIDLWSSTEYNAEYANNINLYNYKAQVGFFNNYVKFFGFSVRCLKD